MATTYGSIDVKDGSNENGAETSPLLASSSKPPDRSLWARLVFGWFAPILQTGDRKKRLDPDDLDVIPLPDDCTTSIVMNQFDKQWQRELTTSAKPSLVRALWTAFGYEYIQAGLLKLVHDLNVFVGPMVLHAMIVFLRNPDVSVWVGLALTVTVTGSQIVMSLCLRHYFFKCYLTGLRVRTAVVMAVYRKALKLSPAERQLRSLGEITNLSSIDAQRLQDLTSYLHALWYSPLQIGLALYFLFQQLGPSSLGGVAVILFMIPATKTVAQWMAAMQKRLMQAKDKRVELNGEVLAGMKVIKLQAWEEPFQKRIMELRDVELRQLLRYFIGSSVSRLIWVFVPLAVSLATFAVYVWTGHVLDVASALTALALFGVLRFPLFMLPQIINNTVEALVSVNRIREFLLCDEYKAIGSEGLEDIGVAIHNLSAAYDSKKPKVMSDGTDENSKLLADREWELALLKSQLQDAEKQIRQLAKRQLSDDETEYKSSLLCLRRIDFECNPGELIAIVGGVGSGKSSFLNSILGEVRQLSGTAAVRGQLAYFSQTPFIMNASLRDNILFGHVGEAVNEELYQRALDCCALRHDIESMQHGDLTEIGEKGLTLSGGQKARVALARAVYHRADVTLIDDALSAVDAHVAVHLFEQAIVGELLKPVDGRPRSVILVTNAIQYLKHPKVSTVVVLQDGSVAERGSYSELARNRDSLFSRYLSVVEQTGVSAGIFIGLGMRSSETKDDEPTGTHRGGATVPAGSKKLMTEESRMTGHVGLNVYLAWARAAGGMIVPVVIVVAFALGEAAQVASNWFLTYWSAHAGLESQNYFLGIYALINIGAAVVGLIRMLIISLFGLVASRRLFRDMLAVVLHAPMSFFDTTPVGRLVNRFSKDMYTVDEQLMDNLRTYLMTLFSIISTVAVISGVTPAFTLCLIPVAIYYLVQQAYFTISYRELKRLDSANRSPIYALLGETVDGCAVIRSFGADRSLTNRLILMLDVQQHAYYLTCAAQSWLAVRLELIGTLIIAFAALSAVVERSFNGANETFAGLAGLSISYALQVTQSLNWSVRMASDFEASMVAVERVLEYSAIKSEGDRVTPLDDQLIGWPSKGRIEMRGVKLCYRDGLPLVLKGLDIVIPAGSKIGVVGRTGAGKSTLVVALLRIVELSEGQVLIDGEDAREIGLAKLRSKIAVIPQDPVLYTGTVRNNLDPFHERSDDELRSALERVGLIQNQTISISSHSLSSRANCRIESLDDGVVEGGSNFSVGQRQLLVIARALLQGSMIVIMDEATASVDAETDAMIQRVMRLEFERATVITVAHRINTIMDSDYILVMKDGKAAEFDAPHTLLKKGGLFRDLVQAAARE